MAVNPNFGLAGPGVSYLDALQAFGAGRQVRLQEVQLQRQQRRDQREEDAYNQQQQTRQAVGGLASAGDLTGAQNAAVAGGDYDAAAAISRLDEAGQKRLAARNSVIGQAAQYADTPEKWDQSIDWLVQNGHPDLAAYKGKFSPEARMAAIASAGQIDDYYKQNAQFTLAPGSTRYDANGQVIAAQPFAPQYRAVGEGQSLVEVGGSAPAAPAGDLLGVITQAIPGVQVTSGVRTAERNRAVGGVTNSRHLTGDAVDLVPPRGVQMAQLASAVRQAAPGARVINEGDHVHVQQPGWGGAPNLSGGARVVAQGAPKSSDNKPPSGYRWTANGALEPIPGGPGDAKYGTQNRKAETDLRKEFSSLPEVKDFKDVRAAMNQVRAIGTKDRATAQDDIALVFSYMKMLDPGSVVREGEFATAAKAAGLPDQLVNMFARVDSGNLLNRQQRMNMVRSAESVYTQRRETYNSAAERYQSLARDYGFDGRRVAPRAIPARQSQPRTSAPKRIANAAEFRALPSGTVFIAPGETKPRIKP